jgi:phosphoserine aminotransferase
VVEGIPLFDDCSSSFLTRPLDWNKVDMAYAHAQKNCGISGLTVMVLNSKALQTAPRGILPELCSFENYKRKNGYEADMNILPIYAHYVITDYVLKNGGLRVNDYDRRSKRLYEVIDNSRIFKARVREEWRSKITVTWNMPDEALMQKCIEEGIKEDLYEFKGHRSIGGFRASLFCPIPDESAYRLADFLEDFANRHQ